MGRLRHKLLVFSLVTAAGLAVAQQGPPPPPSPPPTEPATQPAENEAPPPRKEEISLPDMQKRVDEHVRNMADIMKRMVELQSLAKKDKDVIKLNCVNDKIAQEHELENIVEIARSNLTDAIAKKDEEARYHEYGRISASNQQAQQLGAEAEACIGEDLTFVGPTEVEVFEPDLPEDPTVVTWPDFPVVEPLPVASPQA